MGLSFIIQASFLYFSSFLNNSDTYEIFIVFFQIVGTVLILLVDSLTLLNNHAYLNEISLKEDKNDKIIHMTTINPLNKSETFVVEVDDSVDDIDIVVKDINIDASNREVFQNKKLKLILSNEQVYFLFTYLKFFNNYIIINTNNVSSIFILGVITEQYINDSMRSD
jgi:hypothetical protein